MAAEMESNLVYVGSVEHGEDFDGHRLDRLLDRTYRGELTAEERGVAREIARALEYPGAVDIDRDPRNGYSVLGGLASLAMVSKDDQQKEVLSQFLEHKHWQGVGLKIAQAMTTGGLTYEDMLKAQSDDATHQSLVVDSPLGAVMRMVIGIEPHELDNAYFGRQRLLGSGRE